jgi:phage FluMu protein Com
MWLVAYAELFVIDVAIVHRILKCPNCSEVPFLSRHMLVGSSNPDRCFHCGRVLRSQQAQAGLTKEARRMQRR